MRRRRLFAVPFAAALATRARADEARAPLVVFANVTDDPSVRLEGTGFTGADVRNGFLLAARRKPMDLLVLDNAMDRTRAVANARDAIVRRADVYIQYGWDDAVNAEVGRLLADAEIPVLAVGRPVPGAPLYAADDQAAGRIAGEALARYAGASWADRTVGAIIVGATPDTTNRLEERIAGIAAGLKPAVAAPVRLDTSGNPAKAEVLVGSYLGAHAGQKVLVAALDDATALATKAATDASARTADVVIVGQGCDRSVRGNASDKRELDPANRGSIVLGSVAFFLDRYGYDVLPLALAMAARQKVPPVTRTAHRLVSPANAFVIYPPIDIN